MMRGLTDACESPALLWKAAYRCPSPDTFTHHHVVPGVAGEVARSHVNVRPPSLNSNRPMSRPFVNDIGIYPAYRVSAQIGHLVRIRSWGRTTAACSPTPAGATTTSTATPSGAYRWS